MILEIILMGIYLELIKILLQVMVVQKLLCPLVEKNILIQFLMEIF